MSQKWVKRVKKRVTPHLRHLHQHHQQSATPQPSRWPDLYLDPKKSEQKGSNRLKKTGKKKGKTPFAPAAPQPPCNSPGDQTYIWVRKMGEQKKEKMGKKREGKTPAGSHLATLPVTVPEGGILLVTFLALSQFLVILGILSEGFLAIMSCN